MLFRRIFPLSFVLLSSFAYAEPTGGSCEGTVYGIS